MRELGEIHKAKGNAPQARSVWTEAVGVFESAGASEDAASLRSVLAGMA
jgi:hypothetical protein